MSKLTVVAEPGTHEVRMIREFDAPRELVFKAFTDPQLIPRWWGAEAYETVVDKMEVHKGGMWRFIQSGDDEQYIFNGVFHQINAPESIVQTFEFEGMPGHILLETITFEERDGKTIMTDSSVFQTVEDREGMLQSGMEQGTDESMNRLEELLKTLERA